MVSDPSPTAREAIDAAPPVERRTGRDIVVEAALLIPNVVVLLIRLLADPRVSTRRKVFLGAVVAYAMSPVDVIPDFVIGLGHLDDLIEHWDGSVDGLDLVRSVFTWGADVVPSLVRRMLPR